MFKPKAFSLSMVPSDDDKQYVSELNLILQRVGVTVQIKSLGEFNHIIFTYDDEEVKKKLTRGAGKKEKNIKGLLTVREVREMMQKSTADEVAANLGIGRATLFRRLKKYDDDDLF